MCPIDKMAKRSRDRGGRAETNRCDSWPHLEGLNCRQSFGLIVQLHPSAGSGGKGYLSLKCPRATHTLNPHSYPAAIDDTLLNDQSFRFSAIAPRKHSSPVMHPTLCLCAYQTLYNNASVIHPPVKVGVRVQEMALRQALPPVLLPRQREGYGGLGGGGRSGWRGGCGGGGSGA